MDINCCIVDDHCDILPFLHACWKAKVIPMTGLSLVHVDSHPDLVPPNTSVERFTDAQHLYDVLEGVGGIAEFLIPIMYNGHFENGLIWLRPEWSNQLTDSCKGRFSVGDNRQGRCCVTLQEPYYFDECVVYHPEELINLREVILKVCTVNTALDVIPASKWILDICLDYFTVSNPFLAELMNIIDDCDCSIRVVDIVSKMYNTVCFRRREQGIECTCRSLQQRREECTRFNELVHILLSDDIHNKDGISTSSDTTWCSSAAAESIANLKQNFLALFLCSCVNPIVDNTEATKFGEDFFEMCFVVDKTIRDFLAESGTATHKFSTANCVLSNADGAGVIYFAVLAVILLDLFLFPVCSWPHTFATLGMSVIATLPHHISTSNEIESSMVKFEQFLISCTTKFGSGPEVVCIARSDGDGFTSSAVVEDLQARLLRILTGLSASQWGGVELSVHDLRGECHLKCRELFMSRKRSCRPSGASAPVESRPIIDEGTIKNMSLRKRKLLEDSGFSFL